MSHQGYHRNIYLRHPYRDASTEQVASELRLPSFHEPPLRQYTAFGGCPFVVKKFEVGILVIQPMEGYPRYEPFATAQERDTGVEFEVVLSEVLVPIESRSNPPGP